MAEAYGLWQGLKQVETLGVEEAIVIRDFLSNNPGYEWHKPR